MLEALPKPRLRSLLEHFSVIGDPRQPWKVMYPLREVILLVVCATIADCDDYDEIALWGETHLDFLRSLSEFHFGVPCEDWLRDLMNRIDPALFRACFEAWVAERWPQPPGLVALDGKTSRGSRDHRSGEPKALHLVSAFATDRDLVLGQEAVEEKSNETTAIPLLLERLALEGALVTIDAMGCNPAIARDVLDAKADYLLAVKDNQPTLHAEIESYFATAPAQEIERFEDLDKGHGRLEVRSCRVSTAIGWLEPDRAFPGAYRFPSAAAIAVIDTRIEQNGKIATARRSYITSRPLSAQALAEAVRAHWGIENKLHWVLDVAFKEDRSRLKGHGAHNMAIVRHFAVNLVRAANDRNSIKTRRKRASWDPDYLLAILSTPAVNLDS
ncbi:MAG TPA: ISAs1 family transposase [Caulobacteraceae bacterium]